MIKKPKGNRPTYTLWAMAGDHQKGVVGAGWLQSDGSVFIKLNPLVAIPTGTMIRLYPIDPGKPVPQTVQVGEPEPVELEAVDTPY